MAKEKGRHHTREGLPVVKERKLYEVILELKNKGQHSIDEAIKEMGLENPVLEIFLERVAVPTKTNYVTEIQADYTKFIIAGIYKAMSKQFKKEKLPQVSAKTILDTLVKITNRKYKGVERVMDRLKGENPFLYRVTKVMTTPSKRSGLSKRESEYIRFNIANIYESMRKQARLDKKR